jgi:hypothetical protein
MSSADEMNDHLIKDGLTSLKYRSNAEKVRAARILLGEVQVFQKGNNALSSHSKRLLREAHGATLKLDGALSAETTFPWEPKRSVT